MPEIGFVPAGLFPVLWGANRDDASCQRFFVTQPEPHQRKGDTRRHGQNKTDEQGLTQVSKVCGLALQHADCRESTVAR